MFALVNVAMADSLIAAWDGKVHFNFWRPITAIRLGDTDGNDRTVGDAVVDALHRHAQLPGLPVGCQQFLRGGGDDVGELLRD